MKVNFEPHWTSQNQLDKVSFVPTNTLFDPRYGIFKIINKQRLMRPNVITHFINIYEIFTHQFIQLSPPFDGGMVNNEILVSNSMLCWTQFK